MKKIMMATMITILLPISSFAGQVDMKKCVDTHLKNKRTRDAGLETKTEVAERANSSARSGALRRNSTVEDAD